MIVTEVQYEKRFNTAKYEHEEYRVTATVGEDESAEEVMAGIKALVNRAHGLEVVAPDEELVTEDETEEIESESEPLVEAPAKKSKVKSTKSPGKKAAAKEESEEDEDSADDDSDSGAGDSDDGAAVKKAQKSPKGRLSKITKYSRANDLHKKLFGEIINTSMPGGMKKNAAKAKDVSIEMDGEEFLDADGEVLATFRKRVTKLMKV